jgi:hypothetical protein
MFAFLCEHTKKHQRARNFEPYIGQLGVGHYLASQAWGAQDTEADAVRERMHQNYNVFPLKTAHAIRRRG